MEFGSGVFDTKYNILETVSPKLPETTGTTMVGLPQWGVNEWKGVLYPQKTKSDEFLFEYSQRLGCVEVSSSFYAPVSKEKWRGWKSMTGKSFRFLPKWPQQLTHKQNLQSFQEQMSEFIESVSHLGQSLGTTLLQLPPYFSIDHKRNLFLFLEALPKDFPVAIEFRHTSWFQENRLYDKLENYLSQKNIGMCISDTPARQDLFNLSFTGKKNIIRYLSDDNDEHDSLRLNKWREWLQKYSKQLGDAYFMLHMPDNSKTPQMISHISPEIAYHISGLNQGPQQEFF